MEYCISAIGNPHTPALGAKCTLTGIRTYVLFPLLRLPLSPWPLQPPSKRHHSLTTAPDLNNRPRTSYTTQELEAHSPCPAYLLFTSPRADRREARIAQWESSRRWDWTGPTTRVVDLRPPRRSRRYIRTRGLVQPQQRWRWKSSVPQIIEKDDDRVPVEAEVEAGALRHPKAKTQPARVGLL